MVAKKSDIEKKALKEEQRRAAGLVSARFPEVLKIILHMTYNRKGVDPVLMERTVYFDPDTHAYFTMECMTRSCENGGYDLTQIIANMIRERNTSGTGTMVCDGGNGNLRQDHASISYKIDVEYENRQ